MHDHDHARACRIEACTCIIILYIHNIVYNIIYIYIPNGECLSIIRNIYIYYNYTYPSWTDCSVIYIVIKYYIIIVTIVMHVIIKIIINE